jgi:hypothetical protein
MIGESVLALLIVDTTESSDYYAVTSIGKISYYTPVQSVCQRTQPKTQAIACLLVLLYYCIIIHCFRRYSYRHHFTNSEIRI